MARPDSPRLPPPLRVPRSTSSPDAIELQELAHTSSFRRRVHVGRWLGVIAVVAIAVVAIALLATRSAAATPSSAIVRVMLKTHSGTGFFVAGPDDFAYVVTAYHVIDSGEPILIERTIEVAAGKPYVEAYPDVEVVAFDADADLAVLRLDNVRANHFTALGLADAPVKDEGVQSYGFPESSLSKTASMMSKPGKVLSLVKFPVIDRQTGNMIRDDAVDGLLVSSDIEPGFSGGPTCDADGKVVGVSVTKDLVHRGQNGAVSVTALTQLLARVAPAKTRTEPTPAEIAKLLARIETEYLLLPIEARSLAREQEFVSANDRPRLEQLITEISRLDHDTVKDPKTQLSGEAMLGIALMRLPGRPLETYTARSTRERLQQCEVRERGLEEFFGSLGLPEHGARDTEATPARCAQVAFRPLVWDLTALALEWEGAVREISIVKVETVEADVYRAQVRFANLDHLVDIWLSTDGGRLRIKLFDKDGRPAGLSAGRAVRAAAFEGTWHRTEPRTARSFGKNFDADIDTMETVAVSVATDGVVSITHDLRRHIYENRGRLPCGSGAKLDLGFEQIFSGMIDNGSIVAARQGDAKAIGADMWRCGSALTYDPDRIIVLKLVEGKLEMYRTNGVEFPELAEFEH